MAEESRFDPIRFLRWLDDSDIRYLLIGGQAVRLYGSPRTTLDYDFWVDPRARVEVLEFLESEFGLELSAAPDDRRRPVVIAQSLLDKVDLFFLNGMSRPNGEHLDFEDIFSRSVVIETRGEPPVRLPSIDDLIALKSLRPKLKAADEEDIRFLQVRRHLVSGG